MRVGKKFVGAGIFLQKGPFGQKSILSVRSRGSNTSVVRHNQGYFIIKVFDLDFMCFKLNGSIVLTDLWVD